MRAADPPQKQALYKQEKQQQQQQQEQKQQQDQKQQQQQQDQKQQQQQQQEQKQQQQKSRPHHLQQQTTSSGDALTFTGHSSLRYSKHRHRHHSHSQSRPGSGNTRGGGDMVEHSAAQSSLIDQLLINNVVSNEHQHKHRHHSGGGSCSRQHQKLMMVDLVRCLPTKSQSRMSHDHDDLTAIVHSTRSSEKAVAKALTKQWDVSKQVILATLINCLSHRMRDLQRTEDLAQASEKLAMLRRMRQLLNSIRGLGMAKVIFSGGKAAKQAATTMGLRYQAVSTDMLSKWSSRENEYHLYWMALLEKSAASLAQCQDPEALSRHLEFALALVDARIFPG